MSSIFVLFSSDCGGGDDDDVGNSLPTSQFHYACIATS